ncbi:DUF4240 domain-containing protein [Streptomyces avicenniae]|uniref:DUF4240 domain-containing protein n=1 Tax=Streptomyces avicenniae TaxID=500153 RepID=UPI00069C76CC|nr:DUF4240 domain-containing protein [Streptomyces avicenniae]
MYESGFWETVDGARAAADGDPDALADLLVGRLAELDPQSVTDFARHFESRLARAYRWDLWGAAQVLLGSADLTDRPVDDEMFENFRCALVGRGRAVFEGALQDPDALADLLPPGFDPATEGEAEEVGYAAYDAYERLTGDELPDLGLPEPAREPDGVRPDFDDPAALAAAYPRLWARFRDAPPTGPAAP